MSYLVSGMILGLSSGLAPGPLFTLVLSETLRYGLGSGVKVAIAPVITDLPIIILTLIVISNFSGIHLIMGVISLAGALFVAYLGLETFSSTGLDDGDVLSEERSLHKGIVANLLNPHPYLFWMTVGSPSWSGRTRKVCFMPGSSLLDFICSWSVRRWDWPS